MQVYQQYFNTVAKITYEELKPFINSLLKERTCKECGGPFSHTTCKKCGKVDKLASVKIKAIDKIVANFTYKISNLPIKKITNNMLFNLLYSVEGLDITSVNNLLKKYDYDRIAKINLQKIISEINRGAHLDELDISLIETLIYRNDKEVNLDIINEYFIKKALLNDKVNINYDCFKQIIINFTLKLLPASFDDIKCYILPEEKLQKKHSKWRTKARASVDFIKLSETEVKSLYYHGGKNIIDSIFHESTHIFRLRELTIQPDFHPSNILVIQEFLLCNYIPNYYVENYKKIFFELEAEYNGLQASGNFLKKLKIPNYNEEETNNKLQELINKAQSDVRSIGGKLTTVDKEFDKLINNHPEFLEMWPQLQFVYKNEGDNVIRKSVEELDRDYESAKSNPEISDEDIKMYDEFYQRLLGSGRK